MLMVYIAVIQYKGFLYTQLVATIDVPDPPVNTHFVVVVHTM